ncbi:MAG: hypothetical protein LBM08_05790, partial [Dysgonamonadaceae bacterium]|nr:hypothetical protein [Dysgonamonadaceae bacterium]
KALYAMPSRRHKVETWHAASLRQPSCSLQAGNNAQNHAAHSIIRCSVDAAPSRGNYHYNKIITNHYIIHCKTINL